MASAYLQFRELARVFTELSVGPVPIETERTCYRVAAELFEEIDELGLEGLGMSNTDLQEIAQHLAALSAGDSPTERHVRNKLLALAFARLGATDFSCPPTAGVDKGAFYPGVAGAKITLGNLINLDGITQLTVMNWFTFSRTAAFQGLFTRYNDSGAGSVNNQLYCGINNVNQLLFYFDVGGAFVNGSTTLSDNNRYKSTHVFDGTLSGGTNRAKMYLSTRQPDKSYPADAAEAETITGVPGTVPASLAATLVVVNAILGGSQNSSFNNFGGAQQEVRVWINRALTLAELQAETLDANVIVPELWYKFEDGDLTNHGSLGAAFDGVRGTRVTT